jgi:RNA polymerase-associated protein RTF1
MSESESEVDKPREVSSSDEIPPPFGYQKYFYSAEDKAQIEDLPELERESAITERRDIYDRWTQDNQIRRILEKRTAEEAAREKKRKADDADFGEGQRKSTRQKTTLGGRKVGETDDNLEAYKRQREQKSQRKALSLTKTRDRRRSPGSPFSDADADGESDVGYDTPKQKNGAPYRSVSTVKEDEPMEYADVSRLVISRYDLTKYAFYPTFETAVVGTFVRGLVGMMDAPTPQDPTHKEPDYRLGQVARISEGPPYAFETREGKKFITKQYVCTVDNGKVRQFPFPHISRDEKISSVSFHYSHRLLPLAHYI